MTLSPATLNPDAPTLQRICRDRLDGARGQLDAILAAKGPRGEIHTLVPFNELGILLDEASSLAGLMTNAHPDKAVRDAAEQAEQELQKFATELSLNRDLFGALSAVDLKPLDAATRRLVERTLRDFRRAGVDKDEATRRRIRELNEEIVKTDQEFSRTIREDVRSVMAAPGELRGLPADYLAARPPGPDGKIKITTNYPDCYPVIRYADSDDLRRRMNFEMTNRGFPGNEPVLKKLFTLRHELARLLGYATYADYQIEDKMAASAKAVDTFIREIAAMAKPRADREHAEILATRRRREPGAERIEPWQAPYWSNKLREEKYSFDPQAVRPYFEFSRVKRGILDLVAELFSVRFEPVKGLAVWHPSVEVQDVVAREGGARIGRVYLDLHPREGKFKHAAQFGLRKGVAGRQAPEGALMCNFPDPAASKGPALMDHGEVKTFFHEFGHLMHELLGGGQKWIRFSGVATEWDFVEAPSQLLEEWIDDPAILRRFAHHHETGEPIPADLVKRMVDAYEFSTGVVNRQQMFYAMVSLTYHGGDPRDLDLTEHMIKLSQEYAPYPHQEGTHFHLSFGHLGGYAAMYYTYAWSKVIAKDLFTRFKKEGLLGSAACRDYRTKVLEPGGSRDAADLVRDFLGRPYSFDAFRTWIEGS